MEKFENTAQRRRLSVKPGLTCLWQVSGRNQVTDFDEWVRLDLRYIDNWSIWLDLKILLKTVPAVLLRSRGQSEWRPCGNILSGTGRPLWFPSHHMKQEAKITREQMVANLNEDLSREYQAIIAYVIYSQTMKGAQFTDIAGELEMHAAEELAHAMLIAKQIDYFNGKPTNVPKEVKISDKAEDMLRFDLENEKETIINYRQRIRQAEEMGEFALSEILRKIIAQEQEHFTDLADALGIDNPAIEE